MKRVLQALCLLAVPAAARADDSVRAPIDRAAPIHVETATFAVG